MLNDLKLLIDFAREQQLIRESAEGVVIYGCENTIFGTHVPFRRNNKLNGHLDRRQTASVENQIPLRAKNPIFYLSRLRRRDKESFSRPQELL